MNYKLKDVFEKNIDKDVKGFIVYKIYNTIDNKCYIGNTKRSLLTRFLYCKNSHYNIYKSGNKSKLYRAIDNLGIDNFMVSILGVYDSYESSLKNESYWIKLLNSVRNGYNYTFSGKKSYKHKYKTAILEYSKLYSDVYTQLYRIRKVIEVLLRKRLLVNEENFNKHKSIDTLPYSECMVLNKESRRVMLKYKLISESLVVGIKLGKTNVNKQVKTLLDSESINYLTNDISINYHINNKKEIIY